MIRPRSKNLPHFPCRFAARGLRSPARIVALGKSLRFSGSASLNIWELSTPSTRGKTYFQVLVFPEQPEDKIIGVVDGELCVNVKLGKDKLGEKLGKVLKELLQVDEKFNFVAVGPGHYLRKAIRFERADESHLTLDETAALFAKVKLSTERLPKAPLPPSQPT